MKRILLAVMILTMSFSLSFAQETVKEESGKQENVPEKMKLVGKCLLVGTAEFPIVQFTTEDKKNYSLGGELKDELKHLQNIKISIVGVKAGKKQLFEHIQVNSYEILDVGNGEKPYLGILKVDGDNVYLVVKDVGQPFKLVGNSKVIEKLKESDADRAWVTGELKEDGLRVKKFNVLN